MAEKEEELEQVNNTILYIGADTTFFGNVRDKFKKTHTTIVADFNK